MPKYPHNGMNRRELDDLFIELGGTIEYPRRTGDALYRHRAFPRPVRVNNRRKDSTRVLVALARASWPHRRFALRCVSLLATGASWGVTMPRA